MGIWISVGLIVIALVILLFQYDSDTVAGLESGDFYSLVIGVAILVFLGGGLLASYRDRVGQALKHIGVWLLIFFSLIAVYAFRSELTTVGERVVGELLPEGAQSEFEEPGRDRAVRIRRQSGGHFIARAGINGDRQVRMIVDTGASTVVLRPEDARAAGIDLSDLRYTVAVQTANGVAYAARVRLDSVAVGSIRIRNVDALVARPGALHQSLLGMSFLSRLRSYEFSGDFLIFRS